MYRLSGTRQSYAWGAVDTIPDLLGIEPDGKPFAEYWFGAHALGDSPAIGTEGSLSQLLRSQSELLGEATREEFEGQLPFLVKFLSAATPLSLQAHPNRRQAEVGYARESLLGLPVDSPKRVFKDDWPKPEALIALTPFEGLVGFRDPATTAGLFDSLGVGDALASVIGPLREREVTPGLQEVFLDVLSLDERRHLVDEVLGAAVQALDAPGELGVFARTAVELDEHFPGDPGILAALLLNRFSLRPGEAIALPPGVMHSYLRGAAVEVMANSDNILRGGLTKKHIEVDSLLQVVDFIPTDVQILLPEGAEGCYRFPIELPEFEIWLIEPVKDGDIDLPRSGSARICVATEGEFQLATTDAELTLRKGEAVFVGAPEQVLVSGSGRLLVTASGA